MRTFFKNNGLSVTFGLFFLIAMLVQWLTGFNEYNKERQEEGRQRVSLRTYSASGHFIESTFENWESEFLQMALFVLLTISLRQKGSSESKKLEGEEEVDKEPDRNKKDAPWPVKKGGWILAVYKNSLTIALFALFLLSFLLHLYGSLKDENEHLQQKGLPAETLGQLLGESRFWFESFQNWQSEFLSVFAIIVLSIFLRQKGSSQSKPVDASNSATGE
ncbi:hypothetical protein LZZ85_04645 [Terrimonas sp. NA20]|uniref:Transmembrane protein n=1 Tax=Terrimonas ginsenosidimutans TaxID=2908004 RepID=A0ABS9KML8_9BACT|nr:DUF6766 family protein [Terrimonas ginsenosidimutans]MCG2613553.1 hypothetical protein [Terrimonas ginsenosidimutans]